MVAAYTVHRVEPTVNAKAAELIARLHWKTLGVDCPFPYLTGFWWLIADKDDRAVGFAGLKESSGTGGLGYLCRSGVLRAHRGHGLQRRLIRVRERFAIAKGWTLMLSDTSDNPVSANNLIACNYRLFTPPKPWGFRHTIYWRKPLTK